MEQVPSPADNELAKWLRHWVETLRRENASVHTVRNYETDLEQFVGYLSRGRDVPGPAEIDQWTLRGWMADLYSQNLSRPTIRRKLAAVRGYFEHLLREGVVTVTM